MAPFKEDIHLIADLEQFHSCYGSCNKLLYYGSLQQTFIRVRWLYPLLGSRPSDIFFRAFPPHYFHYLLMRYLGPQLSMKNLECSHFQYIQDNIATKMNLRHDKNFTTIGCSTLVQSVLTNHDIHLYTSIDVPSGAIHNLSKLSRAFLWLAMDNVMGGKCKVNWKVMCRSTMLAGLSILNLENRVCVLRFVRLSSSFFIDNILGSIFLR